MAQFGGSTKLGGGAVFGGGPSVYEAWRETFFDLTGEGVFDRHRNDNTANVYRIFSVAAGVFEGAEVDADRIRSEGLPSLSIETVDEWADIFNVTNVDVNDDCKRVLLAALCGNFGGFTSSTRLDSVAEAFMEAAGSGLDTNAYVHSCSMAQCTSADNAGDGVRYVAILVNEWLWIQARPYWRALQEWCDRSDETGCETTVCVSNTSSPMTKDLNLAEPAFYCNCTRSLIDRDVVRN